MSGLNVGEREKEQLEGKRCEQKEKRGGGTGEVGGKWYKIIVN